MAGAAYAAAAAPALFEGFRLSEGECWAIGIVCALIVLDVVAGVAAAAKEGLLSSAKMREGLWHKAGEVLVVALAVLVEVGSAHVDLGFDAALVVPACVYLVANEALSIVENVCKLNPDLKGSKVLALFKGGRAAEEGGAKEGGE